MAKKITKPAAAVVTPAPVAATVAKTSPARNSPVPKAAPMVAAKKEVTYDMIAKRAYEIYLGGSGGDSTSNWLKAESELRSI